MNRRAYDSLILFPIVMNECLPDRFFFGDTRFETMLGKVYKQRLQIISTLPVFHFLKCPVQCRFINLRESFCRLISRFQSQQQILFTLLALPESQDDLIRYYTFNDSDLSLIRQRRGDANRLGFAVQLCLLRYPGYALGTDSELPEPVILWVAKQVQAEPASWAKYGERDVTRREHAQELRTYLQLAPFGLSDFRALVRELTELAQQTDKGLLLAGQALESLRQKRRILPALSVIDRACSEAIARANRRVYRALVEPLTDSHRAKLDELLKLKAGSSITWLTWLRQAPLKPNSRHMLEHIERLKTFQLVDLPEGLGRHIHQNRLLKLAREGGQMTPKDLGKFEPQRRYATLAAVVLESTATVIDELVDLHDRILVKLFSGAKHKHQQQFQKQRRYLQLYAELPCERWRRHKCNWGNLR